MPSRLSEAPPWVSMSLPLGGRPVSRMSWSCRPIGAKGLTVPSSSASLTSPGASSPFGLSLSRVDYPYFEGFFRKVASGAYHGDKRKYIRVITLDDNSRMDILRNLRTMNQGMLALFSNSDFDIVMTKDNTDEQKVSDIIAKIGKEWRLDVE